MANPVRTRWKHLVNLWAEGLWGKVGNAVWWLYGILRAIRSELPKQEDQAKYQVVRLMDTVLSISFSWWCVGALVFLLCWVFEASFHLQRKNQELIDRLHSRSEIPDLDIEIATLPQIYSTSIEHPPSKEGLYIFIRDISFRNRSATQLSVEVQLHIFLGDDISSAPYIRFKQEDIPFPGMEQAREASGASIGPHLNRIIAIPAMSMKHGYLAYFLDKNSALFFIAPAAQARDMRIIQFLNSQKKALFVIEHMSDQRRLVPLDSSVQISFREKVME
jgi:hypothetical protein